MCLTALPIIQVDGSELMTSQKIEFENTDGLILSGVLEIPEAEAHVWAVFAHCFTCSKNSLAASRIARAFASRGIGVLRFDFTGLGESSGEFSKTSFSSNVDDLLAATAWMEQSGRGVGLLVGHSLGGAAVVVAANRLPNVKAVATLGAPSNAEHVIAQFDQHIPEIENRGEAEVNLAGRPFTLRKSFVDDVKGAKVRDAAAGLNRPFLVMHSPTDQVVSIDNATELFVSAKHPKSFVSLDDADHLMTRASDATFAADVISSWSGRYFDPPQKANTSPEQSYDVIVRETGQSGPFQNEVFVDGIRSLADEPVRVGGAGTGPDPYALVSSGLGACTSMTLRMYADRKGWPLERVTVHLNHRKAHMEDCIDCGPNSKVDVFTREILIEGDLSDEQRSRLLEIADRCPVHRTLESEAVIETQAVIQSA